MEFQDKFTYCLSNGVLYLISRPDLHCHHGPLPLVALATRPLPEGSVTVTGPQNKLSYPAAIHVVGELHTDSASTAHPGALKAKRNTLISQSDHFLSRSKI